MNVSNFMSAKDSYENTVKSQYKTIEEHFFNNRINNSNSLTTKFCFLATNEVATSLTQSGYDVYLNIFPNHPENNFTVISFSSAHSENGNIFEILNCDRRCANCSFSNSCNYCYCKDCDSCNSCDDCGNCTCYDNSVFSDDFETLDGYDVSFTEE